MARLSPSAMRPGVSPLFRGVSSDIGPNLVTTSGPAGPVSGLRRPTCPPKVAGKAGVPARPAMRSTAASSSVPCSPVPLAGPPSPRVVAAGPSRPCGVPVPGPYGPCSFAPIVGSFSGSSSALPPTSSPVSQDSIAAAVSLFQMWASSLSGSPGASHVVLGPPAVVAQAPASTVPPSAATSGLRSSEGGTSGDVISDDVTAGPAICQRSSKRSRSSSPRGVQGKRGVPRGGTYAPGGNSADAMGSTGAALVGVDLHEGANGESMEELPQGGHFSGQMNPGVPVGGPRGQVAKGITARQRAKAPSGSNPRQGAKAPLGNYKGVAAPIGHARSMPKSAGSNSEVSLGKGGARAGGAFGAQISGSVGARPQAPGASPAAARKVVTRSSTKHGSPEQFQSLDLAVASTRRKKATPITQKSVHFSEEIEDFTEDEQGVYDDVASGEDNHDVCEGMHERSGHRGRGRADLPLRGTPLWQSLLQESDMATSGDSGSGLERGAESGQDSMVSEDERPSTSGVVAIPNRTGVRDGPRSGPLRAWIVGHSFVHWAAIRAASQPGGQQLGFSFSRVVVRWLGRRGLCWADLPGLLQSAMRRWEKPHVLIIHLGGNDLGSIPGRDLSAVIQSDLRTFKAWLPGVRMGWSNIIPRLTWRHMANHRAAFQVRKKLNRDVRKLMCELGGFVVEHKFITAADRSLYRGDGVHLTDHGMDLFIEDIRQSLLLFV
ncbi:translation initiation factor IF-2-like [Bombina bombina]|uniref:translation initiation factor IF-2-like n=1 Tax=Bombina bombina TaxID=8345 RepID=UPI00235AEC97|nr:translation initiation factor IF-2-like [Bombina bombina]